MNWVSRMLGELRSNAPADPWPGPPAVRKATAPRWPGAGRTSTWRPIVPGTAPVRASGTSTVVQRTPFVLHGVSGVAACACPGATKAAAASSAGRRARRTRHARVPLPVYASAARYPLRNWSFIRVFEAVQVIGSGRVGSAVAARLRERGVGVAEEGELVLLCVPDDAIAEVARTVPPGPWIAHVSGATPLSALDPHPRRFSVHPLQTFTRKRGAEQLDGAWAAVTCEDGDGRAAGFWLAETLGLRPFELADDRRPLYHAGAAIASTYLVTLHRMPAA